MKDLVEKVARALATEPMPGDYDEVPSAEVFSRPRYSHLKQGYERQAKASIRAVLDAIAEPSEAMVREGRPVMCMNYSERMIYRAMIAALQKEIVDE